MMQCKVKGEHDLLLHGLEEFFSLGPYISQKQNLSEQLVKAMREKTWSFCPVISRVGGDCLESNLWRS